MRAAHTENWLQLLHNPTAWACGIGHKDPLKFTFDSGDKLMEHILNSHEEQFTAPESDMMRRFAERSQILIPRQSDICPICQAHVDKLPEGENKRVRETPLTPSPADMDPSMKATKLSRHIAAHLKLLAFRSLRGILAGFDEDPVAQDSHKASHGQGRDDISELGSQVNSDLDNISLSSYDLPPDNRIVMTVQNNPETKEDRIEQEDLGKRNRREHCLKLEPTRREAQEWYFIQQHLDQTDSILERFRNRQDPILEHFRSHQLESDTESESEISVGPLGVLMKGKAAPMATMASDG